MSMNNRNRMMYNPNSNNNYPHSQVPNSGYIQINGPRGPRHYVTQASHNVSDMKNNHIPNITHGQIQMVSTNIPQRQTLYLPSNVAYPGGNHTYYQPAAFSPQAPQAVIMPYLSNAYPANSGLFYPSTPPTSRAIQQMTTNPPQGPQNTPVANMSHAQNSHGSSLIVQSQPMEMSTNSQPLQVSQQSSSTPIPISEPRPQRRKNGAIKIIDPNTGHEVVVDNATPQVPSADELEKMKVQSHFQSQVQSVVKKEETKSSDNNEEPRMNTVRWQFRASRHIAEEGRRRAYVEPVARVGRGADVGQGDDENGRAGRGVPVHERRDGAVPDQGLLRGAVMENGPEQGRLRGRRDVSGSPGREAAEGRGPRHRAGLQIPDRTMRLGQVQGAASVQGQHQDALDSVVCNRMNMQCKNIIEEYEKVHNLDYVINSLTTDKNSAFFASHKEFVKSMILITLDREPNSCSITGNIFAELLSKNVLSLEVITQGIDAVLVDWNYSLVDYPQLFSYIAAIITPFRFKLVHPHFL